MRVRLKLKNEYRFGKNQLNDWGFIQTKAHLPIGTEIKFEDLNPESLAGDLNTSHYRFFAGRTFKSVLPPYKTIDVELVEV